MNELKANAAKAALDYIEDNMVVGVGTGSTISYFIKALVDIKHRLDACVPSSIATEKLLRSLGLPVIDLNVAGTLPIYIDGADEVNQRCEMIKGGGGALTREKIMATASERFICIVDESKVVKLLGKHPVAVEVIPMARSFVAREIVKLGGDPEYREHFVTDNGNIILDVFNLNFDSPNTLEDAINRIPGVVENGVFSRRIADTVLVAGANGISKIKG